MKFLAWFFFIILIFSVVMRFFGKAIFNLIVGSLVKKAAEDLEKQNQAYQKHTESTVFKQNVYVDEEIKVSVNTQNKKSKKPKLKDLPSEDVEFEEL